MSDTTPGSYGYRQETCGVCHEVIHRAEKDQPVDDEHRGRWFRRSTPESVKFQSNTPYTHVHAPRAFVPTAAAEEEASTAEREMLASLLTLRDKLVQP